MDSIIKIFVKTLSGEEMAFDVPKAELILDLKKRLAKNKPNQDIL
jgi:hypothetical protein